MRCAEINWRTSTAIAGRPGRHFQRHSTRRHALTVRAWVQHRARDLKRPHALELVRAGWLITSLIEMERHALVYAGHTVWNPTAERMKDGYVGREKWRPRDQWMIQRDSHEALISEEEAEAKMAQGRSWRAQRGKAGPDLPP